VTLVVSRGLVLNPENYTKTKQNYTKTKLLKEYLA
jgi:hypothetical protein